MSEIQATAKDWVLTEKALQLFLHALDSDRDQAGQKYEAIRLKLSKIFDWRGARYPEECADETINRVARKLEAGQEIEDVITYCQGVARLVFLEECKKLENRHLSLDELHSSITLQSLQEDDGLEKYFNQCLNELPLESRRLILQYYQDERRHKINNRQAMADLLKIPMNALRSRVQRIRDKLENCIVRHISRAQLPRMRQ